MKFWLLPCVLALATSCSHSATQAPAASTDKSPTASTVPAAPKAAVAKTPAKKAKTKQASAGHTVCKSSGGDERVLEIISKGEGCTVEYTKQQQKQEIASADHETAHCQQVVEKVRGHLEGAGYSCN